MMSNKEIVVLSQGEEDFIATLNLVECRRRAGWYLIENSPDFKGKTPIKNFEKWHPRLILFERKPKSEQFKFAQALPSSLNAWGVCQFAWSWINSITYKEPPKGSVNEKGWVIYTNVADECEVICAISPQWAKQ